MSKDPFKTWKEEQEIYGDIDINSMSQDLKEKNIKKLTKKISQSISDLQTRVSLFDQKKLSDFLENYAIPDEEGFRKIFGKIYKLLEGDISEFIKYLEKNNFVSERVEAVEEKQGINTVVKKYSDMFEALFDQDDESNKDRILFKIANKFFEFCFYPETFEKFEKFIENDKYHPILRLIYSVMWSSLAEIGWQHWHADCLIDLRKEADSGKEVVYIAGGTDIYQLIKHGIYNIRVIDPLLPSQPKYYSNNWEWFVKGKGPRFGLGDKFVTNLDHKHVSMERVDYEKTGETISMKLSNNKSVRIEESITTWNLYDDKKNKLGEVVFERRLTNQKDFETNDKKSLLISFNELYFVASPVENDGWGIDPSEFGDSTKIYVKQLRKSVTKQVVCNIRKEVKQENFAFIELGSCVD